MALSAYFVHHALYGRFGLESNRVQSARAEVLSERLARLEAARRDYQRDVALLSGAPHPDMVEEAARRVLGYAYPNARIVRLKSAD